MYTPIKYKNKYQNLLQNSIQARILFVIVAMVVFFGFQSGTVSAASLSKPANNLGLIGYWSFNDATSTIATDFSGNGNHGTLANIAAPATATSGWGNGKLGSGLNFDGVDDYVETPFTTLNGSSYGTLSFWFKRDAVSQIAPIVGATQGYILDRFFVIPYSDGLIYFEAYNNQNNSAYATYASNDTNWHHVVMVFDGTLSGDDNRLKGYVDGAQVSLSFAGGSGVIASTIGTMNVLNVGRASMGGFTAYGKGKADEVRIYNRALSAIEITSLYNTGAQKLKLGASNNGLIGYWSFNDATSTIATDFSGNGNHGTLANIAAPATATSGWGNGKLGSGLNFDGVDDYVETPFVNPSGNLTISAWMKLNTITASPNAVVALSTNPQGSSAYSPYIGFNSAGQPIATGFSGSIRTATAPTGVELGTWHLITGVFRNSSAIDLYVDGVFSATVSTGALYVSNTYMVLSFVKNLDTSYFNGAVDDVRIYNRALSATEIATLYGSGAQKINASQTTTGTSLDSGLVGMWSFDGKDLNGTTAYDRSGQGNNGTLTNGPVPAIGKVGQALRLDGSDDYMDFGTSNSLNVDSALTISMWFKRNGIGGNLYHGLIQRFNSGVVGYQLGIMNDNTIIFYTNTVANPTYTLTDDNWHHYVVTNDGSTTRFYVDGTQYGSAAQALTSVTSSVTNNIGRYGTQGNTNGLIDEVRIYNRALTASEAKLLYNMGK